MLVKEMEWNALFGGRDGWGAYWEAAVCCIYMYVSACHVEARTLYICVGEAGGERCDALNMFLFLLPLLSV